MDTQKDTGFISMLAGEALEPWRRVKLTAANTVQYADAGEDAIGVTQRDAASGGYVTVKLFNAGGTFKIEAAGTFSAAATIYGAADGKIDDVASGDPLGISNEAAGAAADICEIVSVKTSTVAELDGITAGTVTASKAVVVDANKDIGDFRDVGIADSGGLTFGDDNDVEIEHDGSDGVVIAKTAAQKIAFFGGTPAAQPSHVADPAATASTLTENSGAIGGTNDGDLPALVDPAGDSGASVIAGIRENATMINSLVADVQANNAAIDSILAQLATLGLQASS